MKKFTVCLTTGLFLASQIVPFNVLAADTNQDHNYVDAFSKSIMFYEANWCGSGQENNRLKWRSACHENDGKDVGLDLSGGFHDAGDHVKFGLPQVYAASTLGWGYYEFKDTFKDKGQDKYMLNVLKHFTDYFLKCHPNKDTFYYQCGDGDTDHSYWGPPEDQPTSRPTLFKATPGDPASDVCGSGAAALALMYINYKDVDASYASKCLTAAQEIYNLGKNNKGLSHAQSYYTSSDYWDDLAWGAVWLYSATNDSSYLSDAESFVQAKNVSQYYDFNWTHCWDNVLGGVLVRMSEVSNNAAMYKKLVAGNIKDWRNSIQTTPGGLKWRNDWGTLRYSAAEAMMAAVYYKDSNDPDALDLAKGQIDYMLGSNPANMSYEVGFGTNYPKFPHHRAASGRNETKGEKKTQPEKHILYGALVGGPNQSDVYTENIDEYQHSEVAIDYNAGFVGALAGISKYYGQGQSAEKINDSDIRDVNNDTPTVLGDVNGDGKINLADYILMKKYIMNPGSVKANTKDMDMNGDGKINLADLIKLKKVILGR